VAASATAIDESFINSSLNLSSLRCSREFGLEPGYFFPVLENDSSVTGVSSLNFSRPFTLDAK